MLAVLGDIEFEVAGGLTGLEQRGTADWAEHPRIQGKPRLEWIGEGLDECSLSITLHAWLGDPEARLRALRQAKSQHEPLAFVLGSGDYLGMFVITEVSNAVRRTTGTGQLFASTVQVSLREYTGQFTRKVGRPGLLNPALTGTAAAAAGSPGLISRLIPSPSTTQLVLNHARTAGNVLQAGKGLYDALKGGSPALLLGQVPQLLGVTARAIEPLQGLTAAAGLLSDGADLAQLGSDVLGSVQGARSSLDPVDLGNIVERFAASGSSVSQAVTTLDGASTRLARLAAQVITRRA
jgi:phage protein U